MKAEQPVELHPVTRIGPYRLLGRIGRGGSGEVFHAVHERLQQRVALKLLSPEAAADKQVVSRFLQEGRALVQVTHPGVVRALDCDRLADGRAYLAMEYLEGRTLRVWMADRTLGVSTRLRVVGRIAEIMAAVHARNIVHRDLKPENVFICGDPAGDVPDRIKVLDFGIAKVPLGEGCPGETAVQTASSSFLGTLAYMAPEQCKDAADVDGRADVYALGTIVFELLTGHTPFAAQEPVAELAEKFSADPPHPSQANPEVPLELGTFILSMLSRLRHERPSMARCSQVLSRRWHTHTSQCPLPGLAPFTEAQAELLFGRSEEVEHLVARCEVMLSGAPRWIQLEGPGGAGKSSIIHAGLLPRLRIDEYDDSPKWRVAVFRPATDPVGGLVSALVHAMESDVDREVLAQQLRSSVVGIDEVIDRYLDPGVHLLIVLDSVEELFMLPNGDSDVLLLDALLAKAIESPEGRCRLLTIARSDALVRTAGAPSMLQAAERAERYEIRALDADSMLKAIEGMSRLVGMPLAEGLAERMVRDVAAMGSSLLWHSLRSLWLESRGMVASHALYERIGGVAGALAREAERSLAGLGEAGCMRAKWILLSLVHVGHGTADARRPRTRREVLAAAGDDELAERVLIHLSGARVGREEQGPSVQLVSLSDTPGSGDQSVELLHDAMLRSVPMLHRWIEDERRLLERQQDLEAMASAWERTGAPAEGLPTGSLLDHYCRQEHASLLSERACRFVAVAQEFDARRRRRRRIAIGIAALACVIVVVSALFARSEQARAERGLRQILAMTEEVVSDLDWKLSRLPYTLPVRREMLRLVYENLLALSARDRDDPSVRSALIQAIHRLADVAWMNGTLADATRLLAEAQAEILRAHAHWAAEPGFVKLFALNHSKRGKVWVAMGRYSDAFFEFREAVALFESFAHKHDDPDTRRSLAISYQELAEAEMAMGSVSSAASLLDRAGALLEANAGEYDRSLRTLVLCGRSSAAVRLGEGTLAEQILLGESASEIQPPADENGFHRWVRARVHEELAELYRRWGRSEEAEANIRAAETLTLRLHAEEPSNKRYGLSLLRSAQIAEDLAKSRGDIDEAARLHGERCSTAMLFRDADPLDARFRPEECESEISFLPAMGKFDDGIFTRETP